MNNPGGTAFDLMEEMNPGFQELSGLKTGISGILSEKFKRNSGFLPALFSAAEKNTEKFTFFFGRN